MNSTRMLSRGKTNDRSAGHTGPAPDEKDRNIGSHTHNRIRRAINITNKYMRTRNHNRGQTLFLGIFSLTGSSLDRQRPSTGHTERFDVRVMS